jgi:hypothetical protein
LASSGWDGDDVQQQRASSSRERKGADRTADVEASEKTVKAAEGGVASIDLIDALMVVMSEIIAAQDDAKDRKTFIKCVTDTLPKLARKFRTEGRYPGGHGDRSDLIVH